MPNPAHQALILIDVQNDFCPGGSLAVPEGNQIIDRVNALQNGFSTIVLTQDWHPDGHLSFVSSHANKSPYDMIDMPYGPQVLWPDHCIQGSDGAQLHPGLATNAASMILRKGSNPTIDSYSAFFENDHTTPTGLEGYLREKGITSLVMAGLATDFCVRFSAVDAAKLGFEVHVDLKACRAIDLDGSLDAALADMRAHGVILSD
ncbi:nicotinamidase/pyrazinamidase [Cohaesibacter sp. ES.047]|uniref:bifunctional nicotinamidase/pyrazinamidase n=1 Tax=Cohaesibacter sp. ES.047 TaxID=1798205 RepID=UPI000BB90C78|nr:bifunctional nicotinamidase/pyrazinamidase [Cohaesibacter sp. ES.047]SNY91840.1 nicotinamidase/pyrazinamidase [Cohaesibacter sp. ES.047]